MSAVLIGSFFALCLAGVPIAFAMGLSTLLGILYHGSLPLSLLAQRTLVGVDSYALLAVPFFILAGNLMNSGGITDQIIRLAVALVGRFRGGLALTSVLAATIFSGLSGSAAADASALGKVLIPAMKRQGYGGGFSAALMAAACVNGPIIPPSIPLVIYGLSAGKGVSIIALFLGGLIPGLLLVDRADGHGLHHLGAAQLPDHRARAAARDPAPRAAGAVGPDDAGHHPGRRGRRRRHHHRERDHRRALRALRRLLRLSRAEARAICGRSSCRPRSTRRS